MTNALATQKLDTLTLAQPDWTRERIELVKQSICPSGITDTEFALFMEQCRRSGLDPLLKEAFCVPRRANTGSRERPNWVTRHEFQPSETGMLARAERFPDFLGVQASAVYSEDEIHLEPAEGRVSHKFNPTKRKGVLSGAWARVQRREKTAIVVWVDFQGYVQPTPLWGKIPTTMIEKVARVAALRKAYPEAFGGLYIREELPPEEESTTTVDVSPSPAPDTGRLEAPRAQLSKKAQAKVDAVTAAVGGTATVLPPPLPVALGFGPQKGMPIPELSDGELSAAMELAHAKLMESPQARWADAMRQNLAAIEAEVDRRTQR